MPYCIRCTGTGLFAIEADTIDGVRGACAFAVCGRCDAGNRVFLFLKAVAQGTPVLVKDTYTAGFTPLRVTHPSAVLAPAVEGDFIPTPKGG